MLVSVSSQPSKEQRAAMQNAKQLNSNKYCSTARCAVSASAVSSSAPTSPQGAENLAYYFAFLFLAFGPSACLTTHSFSIRKGKVIRGVDTMR